MCAIHVLLWTDGHDTNKSMPSKLDLMEREEISYRFGFIAYILPMLCVISYLVVWVAPPLIPLWSSSLSCSQTPLPRGISWPHPGDPWPQTSGGRWSPHCRGGRHRCPGRRSLVWDFRIIVVMYCTLKQYRQILWKNAEQSTENKKSRFSVILWTRVWVQNFRKAVFKP